MWSNLLNIWMANSTGDTKALLWDRKIQVTGSLLVPFNTLHKSGRWRFRFLAFTYRTPKTIYSSRSVLQYLQPCRYLLFSGFHRILLERIWYQITVRQSVLTLLGPVVLPSISPLITFHLLSPALLLPPLLIVLRRRSLTAYFFVCGKVEGK